jgi:acyl-CoA thioesterase-1
MDQLAADRVIIWGDSLAKGIFWNEARKRHAYCETTAADIASRRLGIEIVNRAKFGCTAPLGLEMIERDTLSDIACRTAVIEFGGNDCNFNWAEISERPEEQHQPVTSPQAYQESLRGMARSLISRGIRPVLMTLPPIDAARYFRFLVGDRLNSKHIMHWLGDVQQIYRYQEMYSLLVEKVAREFSIRLIDLRQRCLENRGFVKEMICEDGLHLTQAGQFFIGDAIVDLVDQENWRKKRSVS